MATIQNIAAECRSLVDATSTSYTDATLLRRINQAYNEIVGKLIALNNNFRFDDTNYSDRPEGPADLQAGVQVYSYDNTMLIIERVEVQDSGGIWHKLKKIDERYIDKALPEYLKTDGLPREYDERGNSIVLYPAPSASQVTLTGGIYFYFQRKAQDFTTLAAATEPGFSTPYHYLLAYKAALPYAQSYKKDRVPFIMNEIQRMEKELFTLVSNRYKDNKRRVISSQHSTK